MRAGPIFYGAQRVQPAWQLGLFLKNTDRYKYGAGRPQAALSTAVASQAGCVQEESRGAPAGPQDHSFFWLFPCCCF